MWFSRCFQSSQYQPPGVNGTIQKVDYFDNYDYYDYCDYYDLTTMTITTTTCAIYLRCEEML